MFTITIQICAAALIATGLDLVRSQEIETNNGRIRGKRINVLGVPLDVFLGIPFAKSPVGDLRFKYPQPADSWWPEVKDARTETPSCMQTTQMFAAIPQEELQTTPDDFSEDCLHLNIWKPASAQNGSNLAVMVWIYGGGFSIGSIRVPVYNGQYLAAEQNVIVVSINYRVGPFGFAYLGADTIPGNMGLMDQVEAMTWVETNIQSFGGDRNRITLFGQSAGAFSIGYHLLSPLSRDLFNNAIMQSGSLVSSVPSGQLLTETEAVNNAKKFSEALKCSGHSAPDIYRCLKDADAQTIITTFDQLTALGVMFYPVVDGYFLPDDPISILKRGEYKKTNILTGVTKDESTLFFYTFINPYNKTFSSTGEIFNYQHYQMITPILTGITDVGRVKALQTFYESEESPPQDYLEILNQLATDFFMKCPVQLLSSFYSVSNDVYLYSLDHRVSTTQYPEWMGVPHSFDLDLVFGFPLNDSLGFTQEEKELSRNIMTYWSNFAKSDNPNSTLLTKWPVFNNEDQTYMVLDVGSNLATRHGFRRHQCAFVNDILPMIPRDDMDKPVTQRPDCGFPVSGSRRQFAGCVNIILSLFAVSFWIIQL